MVEVTIEQGKLEGVKVKTVTDDCEYYSFKGVPYAEPPIGKLRFLETQPVKPWTGTRKATEHGPICPQFDVFANEKKTGSEDCLYLNVYSPDISPKTLLPVMVFIHGGGLKCGSGNDDHYGPDFLVSHGVILVTINYRLDVFGFLCLDTKEVPGNAGFKDQVLALKWVKQNIRTFGGDPNNITVFGESAGGLSTSLHVLSPLSKGLFQRAIVMSGSPFCEWALSFEPRKRAFVLGKQLGLETEDPDKLLEFLQSIPVERLENTTPCILISEQQSDYTKFYPFTAVVEKELGQSAFISKDPEEIVKSGKINNVDVIIGYTSNEMIITLLDSNIIPRYQLYDELYVPRKIIYNSTPSKILQIADKIKKHYGIPNAEGNVLVQRTVKFLSDFIMTHHIQKLLTLLANSGKIKTYFYQFSSQSERNVIGKLGEKFGITGAAHIDDLMYLFNANTHYNPLIKGTKSYKMAHQFCALFTNFAKYGNPTPDGSMGVKWPEYDTKNKGYLDIDEKLTSGTALHEDVIQFWQEIYNFAGVPY
ncbi:juvenile hormone esterase isoform X3 [Pieris rapae]|uniref:juvenile hormone esterase isoform X3 n=1 Tax=Pieris rapae TaxID=64459 RepID=UPI001E27D78E|nr:juvenile hormone esterase isoform X3 [Pieris rapae]XP_045490455.1 juvenile hormone esterase isoform X3 [Pieris rapae]